MSAPSTPEAAHDPSAAQVAPPPPPVHGAVAPASAPGTARPLSNPLRGVPGGDLFRDILAIVLLLVSLGLPWDRLGTWTGSGRGRSLDEVLIVTLIVVISVVLPYLARAGMFAASWTVTNTRALRVALSVPYLVTVIVYLVLGLATGDPSNITVGTGIAFGLAGVALAAQPRSFELGPIDRDTRVGPQWRNVLRVLGALVVAGYFASAVWLIIDVTGVLDGFPVLDEVGLVIQLLGVGLLAAVGIVMVAWRGSRAWRRVLIALGTALTAIFFLGIDRASTLPSVESLRVAVDGSSSSFFGVMQAYVPWSTWVGVGTVLIPAAAAIAASPALTRVLPQLEDRDAWIGAAIAQLRLLVGLAILTAIGSITTLVSETIDQLGELGSQGFTAGAVTTLVLALLVAGVASYAAKRLGTGAGDGQVLAAATAVVTAILGIIIMSVAPKFGAGLDLGGASDARLITAGHVLLAFGLPLGILVSVIAPSSVRSYFAARRATGAPAAPYEWREVPRPSQGANVAPSQSKPAQQGTPGDSRGSYGAGNYPPPPPAAPVAPRPPAAPVAPRPPAAPVAPPASAAPTPPPASAPVQVAEQLQPERTQPEHPQPEKSAPASESVRSQSASAAAVEVPASDSAQAPVNGGAQAPTEPPAAEPSTGEYPQSVTEQLSSHGFTVTMASDPETPPATLAKIVETAPELRAAVAGNPATYPALVEWLGLLQDPAVDAALASRRD